MKPGRQYLSFYDMQHIQQIRKDSVPQELCPPPVDERERTESVYTLTVEGSGCSRIVQFPSTLELQINSVQRVWRQWETCFTSRHDSDQLKYLLPWHTFQPSLKLSLGSLWPNLQSEREWDNFTEKTIHMSKLSFISRRLKHRKWRTTNIFAFLKTLVIELSAQCTAERKPSGGAKSADGWGCQNLHKLLKSSVTISILILLLQ